MPGWSKTLPKTGTLSDLPREAQTYIKAIEEHCSISVSYIGTGPKGMIILHAIKVIALIILLKYDLKIELS